MSAMAGAMQFSRGRHPFHACSVFTVNKFTKNVLVTVACDGCIVRGKSSMGDLDDIGFPVETAKPKIFHVRVSRTAPALRSPTAARSRAVP